MTLFLNLQVLVTLSCLLMAATMLVHGRRLATADVAFQRHRRMMMWFLLALAAHSASSIFIVRGQNLEVYATQPLTLLYVAFAVLTMWGSLCFGRKHHCRLSIWVLLLQIPASLIVVNALMLASGNYRPLMNGYDLLVYHSDAPVVFMGRVLFMALILVFWLMAAGMLVEAWLHGRHQTDAAKAAPTLPLHRQEARLIAFWATALLIAVVPFCMKFYPPHYAKNALFIVGLLLTARLYQQQVCFARQRFDGSLTGFLVAKRLPMVLALELGGTTPFGSYIPLNPFYAKGNPELGDIASALGIPRDDLSQYVHQALKTNLVAWVSEQRLNHCAEALRQGNRKITEIAAATGYSDVPTFTRAFKRQYGVSPSEYRKNTGVNTL